jgi:hypothetical protein
MILTPSILASFQRVHDAETTLALQRAFTLIARSRFIDTMQADTMQADTMQADTMQADIMQADIMQADTDQPAMSDEISACETGPDAILDQSEDHQSDSDRSKTSKR